MLTAQLTKLMEASFLACGYDPIYGQVVTSARQDLCQFQCNGAMGAAKAYKKAPFFISDAVIDHLKSTEQFEKMFSLAETVKPGFINLSLSDEYLANYIESISEDSRVGVEKVTKPDKIVIDYGGPNVAKPLHVGHLRPAIIGESIKRLFKFLGHEVVGDVHLGDWGLQMGMIIVEVNRLYPDLPYFDPEFEGPYPTEPPFNFSDLEEIYPIASNRCKEDPDYNEKAKKATFDLQNGRPGYIALWKHFVDLSVKDILTIYNRLDVHFDLWYGESDSNAYVPKIIDTLKSKGALYESDGAMVVDVTRPEDKKEIPPIIIYKSDGSILYGTTDLATIEQRVEDFDPDYILYIVDSRQANHFIQVFRCASDHGIAPSKTSLEHIGFGTMNGKDGRPFKTRDGGILKLADFIDSIEANAKEKINDKEGVDIETTARIVGLATLKYADLSNYRMKDYVFDLDKFSSFEGKTGPYILYTYVRINNIMNKLRDELFQPSTIIRPSSEVERQLMLKIDNLEIALTLAAKDRAPNIICEYVYDLATLANGFYHAHHIINEKDPIKRGSWMKLLQITQKCLLLCLDLLGIQVPEKM
ncbi:arginine--tRNA ligase [Petrocella sp. FN5]|uniref:arginine--tRNA ligase n=1 Tax=Petrocella sp. FN5 TaxID=3032002 RepID=UPI0023DB3F11|nr:arginine--tRNA ligase [Petrocella sp. FN5]MDF1618690.1 arginine--tRNA ligase [Petrocella sp. FN5]